MLYYVCALCFVCKICMYVMFVCYACAYVVYDLSGVFMSESMCYIYVKLCDVCM